MIHRTTFKELEKQVEEYKHFLNGRGGSFKTNLYHTISSSDLCNQARLAKGFPAEVFIYNLYVNGFDATILQYYIIDEEFVTEGHKIKVAKMMFGDDYKRCLYIEEDKEPPVIDKVKIIENELSKED